MVQVGMFDKVCSVCGKALSSKSSMLRHKNLHLGIYSYNCSVCGKGFSTKDGLSGHMSWHTGTKLPCPVCQKQFRYKVDLLKHRKVMAH
ncbi:hypothetical protein LSH36_147g01002 [Paralvinella palmiformis]|uniref:C2H2-type domain-containing protein n=1 Tax=Paralvinella palmiformis TaxID=53620 RepID=A0AAD9JV15_9ANNE|nr:hypothetical protein LSH36_147g01002 [Paralvinella palmiformis]